MGAPRHVLKLAVVAAAAVLGLAAARGNIRVDGSSTVFPISLAMAEEFSIDHPETPVSVAFSGTGGGLSKLCAGEVEIADASRVVTPAELEKCASRGIGLIELPVAADALTVVVNSGNDFVECLTVSELRAIWEPGSKVEYWSQVRDGFPAVPITLYGPGTDSGTFEFFTHAINGRVGASRTDFFPSEDDNVLVQGVEGDEYALGFFGYAYYVENAGRLRSLAVDAGAGCVKPDALSIESNAYSPLSRPLFVYVSSAALAARPGIAEFIEYYLAPENREFIADTGYVAYPDDVYEAVAARFEAGITGTAFAGFEPGDSVLEAVRRRE